MTYLKAIENIINEKYPQLVHAESFSIIESAPTAICKEAKFNYSTKIGDVIAYKFDERDPHGVPYILFPFFKQGTGTGLNAMCDGILFYQRKKKNQIYLILCNLKSMNEGNNVVQIEAGELFGRFLIDSARRVDKSLSKPEIIVREAQFRPRVVSEEQPTKMNKHVPKRTYYFESSNRKIDTANIRHICEE